MGYYQNHLEFIFQSAEALEFNAEFEGGEDGVATGQRYQRRTGQSAVHDGLANARYALIRDREYCRLSSAARLTHSSQPQRASCGMGTLSPRFNSTLTIS